MASRMPLKKSTYARIVFPIYDADGDLVTGATAPDSEYSLDGGNFGDCSAEISEIATTSGIYYLDLTPSEMAGDVVAIQVKTTSAGAKTTVLVFYTAANTFDESNSALASHALEMDSEVSSHALANDSMLVSHALADSKQHSTQTSTVTEYDQVIYNELSRVESSTDIIPSEIASHVLEESQSLSTILSASGGSVDLTPVESEIASHVLEQSAVLSQLGSSTDIIPSEIASHVIEESQSLSTILSASGGSVDLTPVTSEIASHVLQESAELSQIASHTDITPSEVASHVVAESTELSRILSTCGDGTQVSELFSAFDSHVLELSAEMSQIESSTDFTNSEIASCCLVDSRQFSRVESSTDMIPSEIASHVVAESQTLSNILSSAGIVTDLAPLASEIASHVLQESAELSQIASHTDITPSEVASCCVSQSANVSTFYSDISSRLPTALLGEGMDITIRSGTIGTYTSTTVFALDAGASAVANYYVGCWVVITGSTGQGQVRMITAYNNSTKAVTVSPALTTALVSNTSLYKILPNAVNLSGTVTGGLTLCTTTTTTGTATNLTNMPTPISTQFSRVESSTDNKIPSMVASCCLSESAILSQIESSTDILPSEVASSASATTSDGSEIISEIASHALAASTQSSRIESSTDFTPTQSNTMTFNATALQSIENEVWLRVMDGGYTAEQIQKIMVAVLAGVTDITEISSGVATIKFKDLSGLIDRVVASMNHSERTAVVITP